MSASQPLAVILDMDGLMLDTEPIARRVWQQAGRELGHPLGDDVFVEMIGRNNLACRRILARRLGPAFPVRDIAARAAALYAEHLDACEVPHKPGLVPFIHFLDARRLPKAVATSTARALARHKLDRAGVLSYFDIVVGGDEVAKGKPAPDIFLMAAGRLNIDPGRCVVLEDSEPGLRAAKAAGMTSILIPDGVEPTAAARASARFVAESLLAAMTILDKIAASREES